MLHTLQAQNNHDYLPWSATRKLAVDDFTIKTKQLESTTSFGQFSVDYEVGGFSFLTKNFNKKVHNYFIRAASWIDTTANISEALRYQQTLFDICEIYTRQFRQALRGNRKQFLKNTGVARELNKQYMAAFAKRRIVYDRETAFGTVTAKQKEWELQIATELEALKDFAHDR